MANSGDNSAAGDGLLAGDPVGVDVESDPNTDSADETVTGGVRARLAAPFSNLFSIRAFLLVLGLTVGGMVLGTFFVPLPGAGLAGIAVAAFAVGIGHARRRYLEVLLAGFVAAGAGTFLEYAVFTLFGGFAPVALGTTAGGIAAVVGYYFGRDLRNGLTRDL